MVTKSKVRIDKARVLAAKTISILPTIFPSTIAPKLTNQQRALVANAVNRSLCVGLADRFEIVAPNVPADLTVRAVVTQATETDEIAAGVSVAGSIGMRFVDLGYPVPVPRVPIGLGSLALEAEAVDPGGRQYAAMLWARGAGAFFSKPTVSKAGDAYALAASFGEDFSRLLVKGQTPFGSADLNLPSWQKINSTLGFAPKYSACESYGRAPGLIGAVGSQVGLPPEWTDKGAPKSAD